MKHGAVLQRNGCEGGANGPGLLRALHLTRVCAAKPKVAAAISIAAGRRLRCDRHNAPAAAPRSRSTRTIGDLPEYAKRLASSPVDARIYGVLTSIELNRTWEGWMPPSPIGLVPPGPAAIRKSPRQLLAAIPGLPSRKCRAPTLLRQRGIISGAERNVEQIWHKDGGGEFHRAPISRPPPGCMLQLQPACDSTVASA